MILNSIIQLTQTMISLESWKSSTWHPNLRKTPRGGKMMAKRMSMQVAAIFFTGFGHRKTQTIKGLRGRDDGEVGRGVVSKGK